MAKKNGNGGDESSKKAPPFTPPAAWFLKAVRLKLGLSQDDLAERIAVPERSMVGRWEMEGEGGSDPSWGYVGRILVALGVIDVSGKELRLHTASALHSGPMSDIEQRVLLELRKLPDEGSKTDALIAIVRLVERHTSNQPPAALKKG